MRTVIFIAGGLVLLAFCAGYAHLYGHNDDLTAIAKAVKAFVSVWFIIAAINLWARILRAGRSAREELPNFLLIFWIPTLAAYFIQWKFA